MKMKQDFISGFASALASLGIEGDHRGADWSEAYKYLQSRLDTFEVVGGALMENLRYRGGLYTDAADKIETLKAALTAAQKYIGNGYQPPELMDQIEAALAD